MTLRPFRPGGRVLCVALLVVASGRSGIAQADGSPAAAIVGGTLGAYSGAFLGLLGATVPCAQAMQSVRCMHVSAGVAALTASVSGALLGSMDEDRVWHTGRNAGIGVAVGGLAAAGLSQVTQRVGMRDVGALGLLGGAIGTAPRGAAIGLGLGGALGLTLMLATDLGLSDAIGFAAAGVAVGGLAQWMLAVRSAHSTTGDRPLTLVAFRLAL